MSSPRNTVGHGLVKDAAWLDALGNAVGAAVSVFYRVPGTRPLKTLLHGTWPLNHPLHPALTDATVGGYTAMAALDVVFLFTQEPGLMRASTILLVLALITSLATVASGLTDWNETYGEERRNGMLHGLVMALASLGFIASLWLRVAGGADQYGAAIAIGLGAWLVMFAAAFLGGEQVFGYGTQVNRQAWTEQSAKWQRLDVAAASLADRAPVLARTKQLDILVAKLDGAIHAVANTCTHAGGPLHKGKWVGADRCEIECPWHGSRFCVKDGAAKAGPATFDEVSFETRVSDDGFVEVRAR